MSTAKPDHTLQILTLSEYRILKAAADLMVPEAVDSPETDLAFKIDTVLAQVRPQLQSQFKQLLWLVEWGGPFLSFRFQRFTRMPPQGQARYLIAWERSRLPLKRMGFQALKRSVMAAYYGSEPSWQGIGYKGPWLHRGFPHEFEGKGIQTPSA